MQCKSYNLKVWFWFYTQDKCNSAKVVGSTNWIIGNYSFEFGEKHSYYGPRITDQLTGIDLGQLRGNNSFINSPFK